MGIVSNSDFESELGKLTPKKEESIPSSTGEINGQIIGESRGRGAGNIEVPNTLRNIIGEESAINGRRAGIELAENFGVSPSSVSAYDVGATSTATYNDRPNLPTINRSKERVIKRAHSKLMSALAGITSDKLEKASARDLSGVAKDMSAVIKNMEPEVSSNNPATRQGPTFVIYAPQTKKLDTFDVIQVKE